MLTGRTALVTGAGSELGIGFALRGRGSGRLPGATRCLVHDRYRFGRRRRQQHPGGQVGMSGVQMKLCAIALAAVACAATPASASARDMGKVRDRAVRWAI